MREKHRQIAADLGLPLGRLNTMYNSRRAQELRCWAETHGRGTAYDLAVYTAFFVDGRNIAAVDVLCDIAASLGLPPEDARNVLEDGVFRQAVDADWARSKEKDIVAAPTLLLEDRRLVGVQPYEKLAAFLQNAGVPDIP